MSTFHEVVRWKNDPVTKYIMQDIKDKLAEIEYGILNNPSTVTAEGHLKLVRLFGVREGLNVLLSLSPEDFPLEEVNND